MEGEYENAQPTKALVAIHRDAINLPDGRRRAKLDLSLDIATTDFFSTGAPTQVRKHRPLCFSRRNREIGDVCVSP